MMEVIHSTNIVFNHNGAKGQSDEKKNRYRKPPSPVEGKETKVLKNATKTVLPANGTKPQEEENVVRQQVFPPSVGDEVSVATNSPLFKPSNKGPDVFGVSHLIDTPLSWKKRESPADSGIELSPISISPPKLNPKVSYCALVF